MKIVFLTPGTGSYYCGACMRDNMLARELIRRGHDVTIAPMYLPLMLDGERTPGLDQTPIFFGGINVYLQQKASLFRKTPAFLDKLLNTRGLLRWVARHSHLTSAREQGALTREMLRVDSGPMRKELDKLFAWLGAIAKPELVCLSTTLLAGFTPEIKRRLGVPVIAFFQGEDTFLDSLPEPYRTECWTSMTQRLGEADVLLAPSRFYADFIGGRMGLAPGAIEVAYNGIELDGYDPAEPPAGPPLIGFLARMALAKGLDRFVEAFIVLADDLGDRTARLRIGGAATTADEAVIAKLKQRLADVGLADRVEWSPNLSRAGKIGFLRSLTLFSVPTVYPEAFGLYTIEAMACGVPVVQPASAAFPEIIAATGGGVCVPPNDPAAMARTWQQLLADAPRRTQLGRAGRLSVEKEFSAGKMAARFLENAARFVRVPASA